MLIKPELLIRKFGIELKRIGVEDLEKLRTWRNSEYVNNRMISNEYITKNMQENWFKGINNEINYYFIAKFNEEDVSVISIKNIENNSGEGAIYLVSEEFENTGILARIVLCFNDFVFDQINLDYIYHIPLIN